MIYSDSNFQYLTPADIEAIICVIREEWPGEDINVRDQSLLDSAIHSPLNAPLGLGLFDIAALYFQSLEGNQPLTNGNKRLAMYCVGQFLEKNGYFYECDDDEAYQAIMGIVENRPIDKGKFSVWLYQHSYPIILGDFNESA